MSLSLRRPSKPADTTDETTDTTADAAPAEVAPTAAGTAERLDAPEAAERLRDTAGQMRKQAADKRDAADRTLRGGHEQANRIIAEAQAEARALTTEAVRVDRDADKVEERASLVDHAAALGKRAEDAEKHLADLIAETGRLGNELDSLNERVADLQESAATLNAGIKAAVGAEDVEEVVALRARLQATEEVAAEVQRRRAVVAQRLAAIGPDGQERARAGAAVSGARAQYEKALDRLDPTRTQRRTLERTAVLAEGFQAAGGSAEDAWHSAALLALLAEDPEWSAALKPVANAPKPAVATVTADGRAMMIRRG